MLLKFYEKDGYFHLKKIEENKLVEMSRKYEDIVEAFIRQTAGQVEIERYRVAMSLLKEKERYDEAVKKFEI